MQTISGIDHEINGTIHHKQIQLAEIVEMIHTASLLHDDVLDNSDTRRGVPSIQKEFKSNKFAILAGDYLLVNYSIFFYFFIK